MLNGASVYDALIEIESIMFALAWPFLTLLVIFVVATAVTGYSQIGFKFRRGALKIGLERLNPVTNLNKLFGMSSVVRTVVSAIKLVVLSSVLYFVLRARMPEFAMMYEHSSFAESVSLIADTAFVILLWISAIVLLLSIGDVAWQRFDHVRNLKMSKQEVEDERKRTDGDPFIKSRLRKAALEIMQLRMMEAIPKADVVITNPTHFAVALKYDRARNRAPEVVAKGMDEVALRIRELAREHDVPLMEDPPLARAMYRAVKVGHEVPEKFYQSVAALLSQVYRLREEVA
jgi:flagellar biosynthetic protein FlhB